MTGVVDLGAKRYEATGVTGDPRKINMRDLLTWVISELDSGNLKPSHMILLVAETNEDYGTSVDIYHAGQYDRFGQIGMTTEAIRMFSREG